MSNKADGIVVSEIHVFKIRFMWHIGFFSGEGNDGFHEMFVQKTVGLGAKNKCLLTTSLHYGIFSAN